MQRIARTRTPALPALLAAAASLGSLVAPAAAQCTWSIGSLTNGFVPDFDQKRQPGPLFWDGSQFINIPAGLPGNGDAYCSPSSHINWMAYFANHGFPGLMPGGSSPSFQSQSEYENVTSAIAELGVDMQTHPTGGTTCCGTSGMIAYLDRRAPGKFTVSAFSAKQLYAPSLEDLAFCVIAGGYVCPFVGWYAVDSGGPNQYYKDGGHVITMVGLEGWCNGSSRQIKVRDPGNGDGNKLVQAAFATNTYALEELPGFFADNDGGGGIQVFYQRTHEKFVGYGSPGLLNGYRVLLPKMGVTLSPLADSLSLFRPIGLSIPNPPPTHSSIGPVPAGGTIRQVEPGAEPWTLYKLANVIVGTQTLGQVSEVPAIDPSALPNAPHGEQVLFTGTDVRSIATGRNRELYIISGAYSGGSGPAVPSVIRIHDGNTASIPIPASLTNPRRVIYSDASDFLLVIDGVDGSVARIKGDNFQAGFEVFPLPSSVAINGEIFVCSSPVDSSFYLRSKNSEIIYQLQVNTVGAAPSLQVIKTFRCPSSTGGDGLDVDIRQSREHILLVKNGAVAEFVQGSTGDWVPATASDFAGLPARGDFKLTRSRTNHDASFMEGPSSRDVLPTDRAPNEFDCPGDANMDGVVSFADITTVLSQYGSTDETPADGNASGSVDFGDITTILANFGPCR